MQQSNLGTNLNSSSIATMDSRHQSPANDKDGILTRKDVVVKSELLTAESEPATEISINDKEIKIKQEDPEDEVVQQDHSTNSEVVGCNPEYRSNSGRSRDSRQSEIDNDVRGEQADHYLSSFLPNVSTSGATAPSSMTAKHHHRNNPYDCQSTDFSRITGHQQQYPGIQHPAYRTPVSNISSPSGVFGFPHFYAPPRPPPPPPGPGHPVSPTQQHAPFANSSSSPARQHKDGKRSRTEKEADGLDDTVVAYRQNAAGMLNEAFLRDYQNELNIFHHGKCATSFPIPTGYSNAGTFRPSVARTYAHHQHQHNNSAYRTQQQQYFNRNNPTIVRHNNKNKWNNNSGIGRAIHPPPHGLPPSSMASWLMRPEIPSNASMSNHPTNPNSTSSLLSKTRTELTKEERDAPIDVSKVHGQTPTICTSIRCTVTGCPCESFTPGKRHLRYCDKCHHGWVLHGESGESVDMNDSLVGTHRVSNITHEDSTFMNNAEKPPDNENAQSSYLLVSPFSSEQRLKSCDSETEGSDLSYGDLPNNQEVLTVNTEEAPEIAELRNWAVRYNVPLAYLDALLKILRQRILPSLPRNGKSFLNTSKAVYNVQVMKGLNGTVGEFVYLGIKNGLMSCIDPNVFGDDTIFLQINIDGASPYRSSTKQLWPVLCKASFKSDIYSPFPVALYYGDTKPGDVHEYMKDFIEEINVLQRDGIFIDDKKYSVQLKHIICDLPARKFLKQVKGHGGYDACERCDVHGKRVGTMSKRVVYPDINCQARSDQSFREQQQQEHHTGLSPLLRIEPPIDMIYAFPLDYMHLCCLGVTKKFYIMDLLFNKSPVKLRANVRDELFKRIVYLKPYVPDEFQRKPRPPVPNLKATELRFIALYAGPIIFKKILNAELYDHFLLFHTALRILSMKGSAQEYNDAAATYLRSFFSVLPKLYGEQSHVLNAHYLLHLADDVRIGKCTLNDLSAFPFENYLGLMRKSIRSANKPLAQICRRLHEKHPFITKPVVPTIFHILKKQTTNSSDILLKLRYKNCILTTKQPNNLVMLNDRRIIKITSLGYVSESEDDIEISGLHWVKSKSIFKYPTDSADLYMWELRKNPSENVIIFNLKDIHCKMVQMRIPPGEHSNSEKIYVVPLLH